MGAVRSARSRKCFRLDLYCCLLLEPAHLVTADTGSTHRCSRSYSARDVENCVKILMISASITIISSGCRGSKCFRTAAEGDVQRARTMMVPAVWRIYGFSFWTAAKASLSCLRSRFLGSRRLAEHSLP